MKINALQQAAALVPARVESNVQAALWRRALEQAQWQSDSHGAAPARAAAPARQAQAELAMHAAQALRQQPALPDNDAAPPALAAEPAGESVETVSRTSAPEIAPTPAPATVPPQALPPAATWIARPAAVVSAAPSAKAQPPLLASAELPVWPLFATQASLRGNQVSAAVRDSRLGPAGIETLRRALARQLSATGLQLAELRVNGQPIEP